MLAMRAVSQGQDTTLVTMKLLSSCDLESGIYFLAGYEDSSRCRRLPCSRGLRSSSTDMVMA